MELFGFVWLSVFIISSSSAYKDGEFEVEKIREGLNDILIVKDITGKTVAVIDVFADGEYQLVMPIAEDDYVCYVSRFKMKEQETTACYEGDPLPKGEEYQIDLTECEDREIVLLSPTDCERNDMKRDVDGELKRQKRSCTYKEELQSQCLKKEKYCTNKGFLWACNQWGYQCVKYKTKVVKTRTCD